VRTLGDSCPRALDLSTARPSVRHGRLLADLGPIPLKSKLGIRDGMRVAIVTSPSDLDPWLREIANRSVSLETPETPLDLLMILASDRSELDRLLRKGTCATGTARALWLAWPKRSSGRASDLSGEIVREAGLASGRVDVKVCSIDRAWSALKFVFRHPARYPAKGAG
jgi:hypothetical protein